MSFIVILILLLLTVACLILNHRRTAILIGLITLTLFFLVGSGIITQLSINALQSHPPLETTQWKKNNAIVLLGIGITQWPGSSHFSTHTQGFSRIHEAARLYYGCKKQAQVCRIIISGGDPAHHNTTESAVMAGELMEIGIPSTDIIMETKSRNTFENAKFSNTIIRSQNFDNIILVTSGFHMRRSLLFFQSFGLKPLSAPSDRLSTQISHLPLAQNFAYLDLVLHEYLGMAQYYLYQRMGWNNF